MFGLLLLEPLLQRGALADALTVEGLRLSGNVGDVAADLGSESA